MLLLQLESLASEIDFSCNADGLPTHGYGYGKEEIYDVAILIDEPSLEGTEIRGIEVELPGGTAVSECSGWLSKELSLKRVNGKNVNNPDIADYEGVLSDGMLRVTFTEPYKISGPVYVGYSFMVDALENGSGEPVMIADCVDKEGLFIHTSRTKLKWNDISEEAGGVSAMKVIVAGDFMDNAAVFQPKEELMCSSEDQDINFTLRVANHGLNAIESIVYRYTIADKEKEEEITFKNVLPSNWGASQPVDIKIGQMTDFGNYTLKLEVLKVNGQTNNDIQRQTNIPVKVYPFTPVNRPLVEEYTGLWCGWCVRGYVALETMHEDHSEKFVAVTYHNGDPMAFEGDTPDRPSGYPDAYINRNRVDTRDIVNSWPNFAELSVPADIDVSIEWADESKTKLKATSITKFAEDNEKTNYGVSYILVIDGLSNPQWGQSNSYAPAEGEEPGYWPEMDNKYGEIFTHGPDVVFGLTFNDVALEIKEIDGFQGSIPTEVRANEEISHSCMFDLSAIANARLIQDKGKLRVVAALIDRKKGKPVNCNTSLYPDFINGVDEISGVNTEPVYTQWYSLQGVALSTPMVGMGMLIRVERFADGTVRSYKQYF